jgi:hypothetical protein
VKINGIGPSRMAVLKLAFERGYVTHQDSRWIATLCGKGLLMHKGNDKYSLTDLGENYYCIWSGDFIEDGFGSIWSVVCPDCHDRSMEVLRPGHAQCMNCG